ncbi:MAG: T9SS type A sorting domain-containing protein [Candidatus Zixiibacteriota bacterium]|nr:MAG: T9SS type A sorting domain-containing protein [candidate division Zixibacteria bacterium]
MITKTHIFFITVGFLLCLRLSPEGATNPDLISPRDSLPEIHDIETAFEVVCDVGKVHNRITNNTVLPGGTNEWTILFGDDTAVLPSMTWREPEIYLNNLYLYFASLRIGRGDKLLHLSTDTSDTLIVSQAISDFDTDFYISDDSPLVPPQDKLYLGVHQYSYAWDETDADDFIIYEFWIVNLNQNAIDSVYVALHADCDVSGAEGGIGLGGYYRDDLVDYYRDDVTGEYISYMYDGDSPAFPGNDIGGRHTPKESRGYIGSRLLYCPPITGSSTPSVQQGHGWWDWNSDPGLDEDWMILMRDDAWLDPPPSPHDFRFLQKLGPFEISADDSIKIAFAFGIGNGLYGMRSNLNNAHLLYQNNYVYYDLPPSTPPDFRVNTVEDDIHFTWYAISDSDFASYNIYQSTDNGANWNLAAGGITDTTYTIADASPDFYHFYVVSQDLGANESMPSRIAMATTLPPPPGDFRAIPGNNHVDLSWSVIDGATSYKLYRSILSGGPYSQIAEVNHPGNSYADNNVTNYQAYYYVATTIKEGYESPYSGEVEVMPNPSQNGRVLLVDDYVDRDQYSNPDFQKRRRFYERWGVYNFDYDVWSIADSGMIDSSTILNYQAVVFASDGDVGLSDMTWWFEIGNPEESSLHYYMENGGRLLAIGQFILLDLENNYPPWPQPGDFEYEYFGVDSTEYCWDYWYRFTWAVGAEPGYPDSMKIDVAKNGDQNDYAIAIYSIRPDVDTLFTWGLWVDGNPPPLEVYQQPVGIIYRPGGTAISALMNFSLYFMPNLGAQQTMTNILRDEFGCTYYVDPPPLPPWRVNAVSILGGDIEITWDGIDESDVVRIILYRSIDSLNYFQIAMLASDEGNYIDEDTTPATTYYYRLSCIDFAGQISYYSNIASEIAGRPQRPENPDAQSGDGQVALTWERPDDPAIVNYKIYKAFGYNGNFNLLATVPYTDSTYTDLSVTNRLVYSYYLTSISDFGIESYNSDTVYAFPYAPGREGILVVNGIDWDTYGEVYAFYDNNTLTGNYPYFFWDLFDNRPAGVIDPGIILGEGEFPAFLFDVFQTIIWAGNNYSGDLEYWEDNLDSIVNFLETGGYVVLPTKHGHYFFNSELTNFAGIDSTSWEMWPSSTHLISTHANLIDISIGTASQSLCYVPIITGPHTTRLWKPSDYSLDDYAGGFIAEPPGQGKFVYIAGRSYRWNRNDLRDNMEVILGQFFGMTGVDENNIVLPKRFILCQNYPNPFNPNTIIKFGLPVKSDVRLEIFDILGRSVNVLINGELAAGYHEIIWDGKNRQGNDIASGIYFYRLETESFSDIRKMLLLK